MDENTVKEIELLILHLAQQWTSKRLHMTPEDIAKKMPNSLVAKLDSLNDTVPVLQDLIQRQLIYVAGSGMYQITPSGIFYLRKYILTISLPENRQKINGMIKEYVPESSKKQVDKFLDGVKNLSPDEKGIKIMDFLKGNSADIVIAIIRIAILLTTGTPI
jgi:hypothetical protein